MTTSQFLRCNGGKAFDEAMRQAREGGWRFESWTRAANAGIDLLKAFAEDDPDEVAEMIEQAIWQEAVEDCLNDLREQAAEDPGAVVRMVKAAKDADARERAKR